MCMDMLCGLSDAVDARDIRRHAHEAVMEHSLLHSYDSGFHHSAKFVGCCVSERYATAFLFLPSCSRVRPCCATAVTAAWAKRCSEALRHFRPHGPQRRWTTTALQSVLRSGFLVSAFWLKIVGSCVSEAVAHEHDTPSPHRWPQGSTAPRTRITSAIASPSRPVQNNC